MNPIATGPGGWLLTVAGLAVFGGVVSLASIRLLHPWLVRYALARPSARGLHREPTPQGGGIAVLAGCAAVTIAGAPLLGVDAGDAVRLTAVLAAAAGLAGLGLIDDIRPLPPLPRLLGQFVAMGIGVMALPDGTRVLPFMPAPIEAAVLVLGGAWFINLTNFMDGMDWLTVVEMVPVTLVLVVAWTAGALAVVPGLLVLGLLGGLIGYAPANRPVARLFLGDVGSLPIGFLVAYGLFSLAGHRFGSGSGPLCAAVLLVLYYLADSGITLAWRLRHGQRVWEPHRSHFYQVAVARGLSVPAVLRRVAATNGALALMAVACLGGGLMIQVESAALGCLVVGATLVSLGRGAPGA